MIDLHTHTTASDGKLTPDELAASAAAAGVTVLGLTDHDTVAGCAATEAACLQLGLAFVAGIEITAVAAARDVHVLGYFFDTTSEPLLRFLAEQRQRRVDRVRAIVERLGAHGVTLDLDALLRPGLDDPSRAVGRPWIARALIAGGHVKDVSEAFDRWLSPGRPGFVPRTGASPEEVIARIHAAGGLASLAHPVLVKHDEWIPAFAEAGLDALEAYHPDHDAETTARYLGMAHDLGLLVTGGSDFHAVGERGRGGPGSVSLPPEAFERLRAAAGR